VSVREIASPRSLGDRTGPLDAQTPEILAHRRSGEKSRRRGWLVRRMLLSADVAALALAVLLAEGVYRTGGQQVLRETVLLLATLPAWVLVANLYGLYDRDEERTGHSTADELAGVFNLVTAGSWLLLVFGHLSGLASPNLFRMVLFWALAIVLLVFARGLARSLCRRSALYLQNAVIVGAGDVGQLVARKLLQHPEYGVNVVGFVDAEPKERRSELAHLAIVGTPEQVPEIVRKLDVDRVVIAFSNGSSQETVALARSLRDLDVQIDVVPRLFDVVGRTAGIHTIEGLPLLGLPRLKISRSSRLIKRSIDVVGASAALLVTAPLFALCALLIKHDSAGPVFFRQQRLGRDMREFVTLKFRTMHVDADDGPHREYIRQTMSPRAEVGENGLYKLARGDAVTHIGRWLRETSLDELPQLVNVLRGEMSLVGPRPCLAYEVEHFAPHHFDRFLVPSGITGLWQVQARGRSTFGEALDMDVAYARSWSLGLDFKLLCLTPLQLFRKQATA
jgi:exopolysaccharide biosynthesis polyprenyl glycosylphosphotransferase